MIKVLLVNKQRLLNEAIESLLSTETDIEVVGAMTDGVDAMTHLQYTEIDIVLLDLHLTSVDGIKLTVHIKDNYPHMKVILLTSFLKKELVVAGIVSGADGFLLKDIDADNLLHAIRNVYKEQIIISGEAARILAEEIVELKYDRHEILKQKLGNRHIYLTDKELEISLFIVDKLTNRQIAQKMFLSEGTIRNYISEIYSKLNTTTRKEAIEYLEPFSTSYYQS